MIHDRGNIKWVSMMLPEHVQQLKELAKETEKKNKPIVDEQTYEQFDELLSEAISNGRSLSFTYYKNGIIEALQGKVDAVDGIENQLKIVAENAERYQLKLEDIVAVEQVDEE